MSLVEDVETLAKTPLLSDPGHDDVDHAELTLTEVAGLYTVTVSPYRIRFVFDRLVDERGGVKAEATVTLAGTELLSGVDLVLKSDTGHTKLAKSLEQRAPGDQTLQWKILLQRACALVLKRHRAGEPLVRIDRQSTTEPLTFAINPLVPRHKPSILFADGGKGKSTLALTLAMAVSTGQGIAGFSALKGTPMYLDWEDDHDVHTRRLHAIRAGHPELDDAVVWYQRCVEPLPHLAHDLVRKIQAAGITFLVVDSLLLAMGGDSSAESVTKFFCALRTLQVETLCIGHVPKTLGEGQEQATVYGSVFNQNLARNLWELRTEQDVGDDSAILGLIHRKSNLTRKHPPIGLKVTHNESGTFVHYDSYDLSQTAELAEALPIASRIRNFLEQDGGVYTAKEISDDTGIKLSSVKFTLSKHRGLKWHMIGDNRNAKWTVITR